MAETQTETSPAIPEPDTRTLLAQLAAVLQRLTPAAAATPPAPAEPPAAAPATSGPPAHALGQLVVRDGRYGVVVAGDPDQVTVVWLVGPHEPVPGDQVEAVS